jgi:hypothetical protein
MQYYLCFRLFYCYVNPRGQAAHKTVSNEGTQTQNRYYTVLCLARIILQQKTHSKDLFWVRRHPEGKNASSTRDDAKSCVGPRTRRRPGSELWSGGRRQWRSRARRDRRRWRSRARCGGAPEPDPAGAGSMELLPDVVVVGRVEGRGDGGAPAPNPVREASELLLPEAGLREEEGKMRRRSREEEGKRTPC